MTAKEYLEKLPGKVAPEAIEGKETVFHFDLRGDGGGQVTLTIKDNQVTLDDGLLGDARCEIRADAAHFIEVCQGDLNPMFAVLTGKLKISDKKEMMEYARIFGFVT